MGKASRAKHERRRSPTGSRLAPIREVREMMAEVARGSSPMMAFFKYVCPACGAYRPISVPNVIPDQLRCPECGAATSASTLRDGGYALVFGDVSNKAFVREAHARLLSSARAGGIGAPGFPSTDPALWAEGPRPAWAAPREDKNELSAAVVDRHTLWVKPKRDAARITGEMALRMVTAPAGSSILAVAADLRPGASVPEGESVLIVAVARDAADLRREIAAAAELPGHSISSVADAFDAFLTIVGPAQTVDDVGRLARKEIETAGRQPRGIIVDDIAALNLPGSDTRATTERVARALEPLECPSILIDRAAAGSREVPDADWPTRELPPLEAALLLRYRSRPGGSSVAGPADVIGERALQLLLQTDRAAEISFRPPAESLGLETEAMAIEMAWGFLEGEPTLWLTEAVQAILDGAPAPRKVPEGILDPSGDRSEWWTFADAFVLGIPGDEPELLLVDALFINALDRQAFVAAIGETQQRERAVWMSRVLIGGIPEPTDAVGGALAALLGYLVDHPERRREAREKLEPEVAARAGVDEVSCFVVEGPRARRN